MTQPEASDLDYEEGGVVRETPAPSRRSRRLRGESAAAAVEIPSDSEVVEVSDGGSDGGSNGERSLPAPPPKKKRKAAPKKPKAPKVPYHVRITNALFAQHPELEQVFAELAVPDTPPPEVAAPPMATKLLPFQQEGLAWLVRQEDLPFQGGVLADEMGMGKTVQTIALLAHSRQRTLIVLPTVALGQWKSELNRHAPDLAVKVHHGALRTKTAGDLVEADVVLTTYGTLESEFRRKTTAAPLLKADFYRVVLDEAHGIKDRNLGAARAARAVPCSKRWCLTGTPLQNRLGELYLLVRFLGVRPFGQYFCTKCECKEDDWKFSDWRHCDSCGHLPMVHLSFFNHFFLKGIQKFGMVGWGSESFDRLQLLLKKLMLRRTKVERADDLGLPPRVVEIRRDVFSPEEKDLYRSLFSGARRQFDLYVAEGVVLNNYANIFTLLTRMRQLADHPDLVLRGKANSVATSSAVCQLCEDVAEDAITSKCHHVFCRMCVSEYVGMFPDPECPVCHVGLLIDLEQAGAEGSVRGLIVSRLGHGNWRLLTKIEALVEELYRLRLDRATVKLIVFSQFTSMLDLVEWRLKRAGFQTCKLLGSMTPLQRDATIKHFMETPAVEVFLVLLKAGGVALNLVEASQVFLLDPWWNPAVEWQLGDRVHRIGQHRPVRIVRMCIEDLIELRIVQLQQKKADMVGATLSGDDGARERLLPGDLQFLFTN